MIVKFLFTMLFGEYSGHIEKLKKRHAQIKTKIFSMTSKSNLKFARTGICFTMADTNEDAINIMNKIQVYDKPLVNLNDLNKPNIDKNFEDEHLTRKDYKRLIELLVTASIKTKKPKNQASMKKNTVKNIPKVTIIEDSNVI